MFSTGRGWQKLTMALEGCAGRHLRPIRLWCRLKRHQLTLPVWRNVRLVDGPPPAARAWCLISAPVPLKAWLYEGAGRTGASPSAERCGTVVAAGDSEYIQSHGQLWWQDAYVISVSASCHVHATLPALLPRMVSKVSLIHNHLLSRDHAYGRPYSDPRAHGSHFNLGQMLNKICQADGVAVQYCATRNESIF
jgi:hypothetical protein